MQWLLEKHPAINDFARGLTQHYYRQWRQQLLVLHGQSALARYQWLLNNHPDLILRVPFKHPASWLGMAEVTFSKVRGSQNQSADN